MSLRQMTAINRNQRHVRRREAALAAARDGVGRGRKQGRWQRCRRRESRVVAAREEEVRAAAAETETASSAETEVASGRTMVSVRGH